MLSAIFGSSEVNDDVKKAPPSDTDNSSSEDDETLLSRYPTISKETFARFKAAFGVEDDNTDLIQKLNEYVEYRTRYELDADTTLEDDDAADWKWASDMAIQASKTCKDDLIPGMEGVAFEDRVCNLDTLPQLCFVHKNKDGTPVLSNDGNPVIYYISARLDLDNVSQEIHALCFAFYLERKVKSLQLDDNKKAFLLVSDTRQGAGWPNHTVLKVVGWLRFLTNTLHKLHAGRMDKLIMTPVPWSCVYVFTMLQGWLPTSIAEKIILVDGVDALDAPPPKELSKYVSEEYVTVMEETRHANFISS